MARPFVRIGGEGVVNLPIEMNIDPREQEKFDDAASGWWDPEGPFRPLHDLNLPGSGLSPSDVGWIKPG